MTRALACMGVRAYQLCLARAHFGSIRQASEIVRAVACGSEVAPPAFEVVEARGLPTLEVVEASGLSAQCHSQASHMIAS